ncbi:hypothetical protein KDK_08990 [Dictyobacter kobayashii]|uniref:Uncharacterized protein n=1 Tax=Dictyobacter kobayashii TaxID=2014872 RepID=A0A402ADB5_9CHLR|nr:hypothetical protein KDK_08990 [Dictyobacter kobayashii]
MDRPNPKYQSRSYSLPFTLLITRQAANIAQHVPALSIDTQAQTISIEEQTTVLRFLVTAIVVVGLTYFAALALGPMIEQLRMA